ncbi:ParA family protein [Ruegeria sp. HKCCA5929]|uniref:ParA family protein n=1 Tax=Ruegeria sp. HKCCA5929 TaxID=2682988 RepID=UPI001489A1FE|nr:ParA family protein [Ruegeria sp. HKCCA5929]
MTVIAFASTKGGAGKTTATIVLGTTLAQQLTVTIIDADPAARVMDWAGQGPHSENIHVVACADERRIQQEIKDAQERSQVVLVDLEGVASRLNSFVIAKSDLVIVPMADEQQDAKAAVETLAQVKQDAEFANRQIPARVLFTRTQALDQAKARFRKMINSSMRGNVPCFDTELKDRGAFSNLHNTGGSLEDLPKSVSGVGKAMVNAKAFAAEVSKVLRGDDEQRGAA